FHQLSVKVKRPGLAVRARKGYVATPRPVATMAATIAPTPVESGFSRTATDDKVRLKPDTTTTTTTTTTSATRLRPAAQKHIETLGPSPNSPAATQGWEAYQRGDLESARSSLTTAAADGGARPWVHYALGQAQYGLGDYAKAIDSWERVRKASPEFEPVYF